jgi:hypothetical protein
MANIPTQMLGKNTPYTLPTVSSIGTNSLTMTMKAKQVPNAPIRKAATAYKAALRNSFIFQSTPFIAMAMINITAKPQGVFEDPARLSPKRLLQRGNEPWAGILQRICCLLKDSGSAASRMFSYGR